jgi:hypothetical protein
MRFVHERLEHCLSPKGKVRLMASAESATRATNVLKKTIVFEGHAQKVFTCFRTLLDFGVRKFSFPGSVMAAVFPLTP